MWTDPKGTRTGPDRCTTDKGALTRIATFSERSTRIFQYMLDVQESGVQSTCATVVTRQLIEPFVLESI